MLLLVLYIIAITAEAMTAALAAGRRDMDWVGVCTIACVTALGGGSVRDVLLGHYPLTWVQHPEYLWITAGAAILTALIAPIMRRLHSLFLLLDAMGLSKSSFYEFFGSKHDAFMAALRRYGDREVARLDATVCSGGCARRRRRPRRSGCRWCAAARAPSSAPGR